MRISNPKTTAGGMPLATTWYVNKRFEGTKGYIDAVSGFLSGYTDQQVGAAETRLNNTIDSLSASSNARDGEVISAFCKYITGTGNDVGAFITNYLPASSTLGDPSIYTVPKAYGYAYLGPDKKIATELMPDISVMDVNVVDVKDVYTWLKDHNHLNDQGDFYNRIHAASGDIQTIVGVVKDCIETYIIGNQSLTGAIKAFGQGDIVVVTHYVDEQATEGASYEFRQSLDSHVNGMFKNVFSQSYIAGAWICNGETRVTTGDRVGLNNSIEFVKISYNQGEITSVNNLVPANNGDIYLNLANIWRTTSGDKVGAVLAKALECVKSTESDANARDFVSAAIVANAGLVPVLELSSRFVFDNDSHNNCHAYTTADEFISLNNAVKATYDFVSGAHDTEVARAKSVEQFLSGNIDTAFDQIDYISGVVGSEAELSGVTVTSALLSVKDFAETAEKNIVTLSGLIDTDDYDVLRVFTATIPSGSVTNISGTLSQSSIKVETSSYKVTHLGWDDEGLYEGNIYNYFGFKPAAFTQPDIAEIKFSGFNGKILDIYVDCGDGKFEKIDADIDYKESIEDDNRLVVKSSFTILGEYDESVDSPYASIVDRMIVRYTNKLTYYPDDTKVMFK